MADEETQGPEDTSWWAADAFSDSPLSATSFDEPLVWPEALHWDQPPATDPAPRPDDSIDDDADAMPVPAAPVNDAEWQPALDEHSVADPGPLAGLGGGTAVRLSDPPVEPPAPPAELDDLPTLGVTGLGRWPGWDDLDAGDPPSGSIWADEAPAVAAENMLVTSTLAASAVYATADGAPGGRRWPRVNVRPGNAAVIALISIASLVLLGMFLSVRARNEVPTDASQIRRPGDGIAVTATLNTVPFTTTVPLPTTVPTVPSPAINLADLIPAPTAGASESTATTTATTRPTTSSAGASTATTRPAPQTTATTATTAAPETTPEPSTPTVTSSPVDTSTPTATTRPPTPTTTFTWPDIPGISNFPIPTLPQRRGIAGFSGMPNDNN